MNGIWGSEDIANNWMLLDLKNLRREVEAKGGKWDVDGYCKSYIDDPELKLPLAYVDKRGNVFFNEAAKRFERPEEIKQRLIELWSLEYEPIVVLLTRSLRELAEVAPNTLVTSIEGEGPKESLK